MQARRRWLRSCAVGAWLMTNIAVVPRWLVRVAPVLVMSANQVLALKRCFKYAGMQASTVAPNCMKSPLAWNNGRQM